MTIERPELTLERVLVALEHELLEATEDEILYAAHELGMDLSMRASAAFVGVKLLVDLRANGFMTNADHGTPIHSQSGASSKANVPRSE